MKPEAVLRGRTSWYDFKVATVQELLEAALALDPAELEELLSGIAGRFADPPISPAWLEAARQRSAEFSSGAVQGVPWADVRERMFKKVNGAGH